MTAVPPEVLGEFSNGQSWPELFRPAPELTQWALTTFVTGEGGLVNPDHHHLADGNIAFLWAAGAFSQRGRIVIGQCEQITFRCSGWQRWRQEQQILQWFGTLPDFMITIAADYASQASDAEFCALIEHELYHIGQALDDFGAPRFTKEGMPKLSLRGHDVEEFIGVVRRYGPSREVQQMLDAANRKPEVGKIEIARACGTCQLRRA